jgi:hypothetical protein
VAIGVFNPVFVCVGLSEIHFSQCTYIMMAALHTLGGPSACTTGMQCMCLAACICLHLDESEYNELAFTGHFQTVYLFANTNRNAFSL